MGEKSKPLARVQRRTCQHCPVEKSWACACKSRLPRPTFETCGAYVTLAVSLRPAFRTVQRSPGSVAALCFPLPRSHFAGDHGKTTSLFRPRRFDCWIKRQTVGLEGDSLNDRK